MFNKRISIFVGHFGSGKTEVAVNFALKMSEVKETTAIVDFDIVNPYFRTADAKADLEAKNIWVITPLYANTNVDVPSLPPEINTLFEKREYSVVFDVGGDDLGARVLSRYRDEILQEQYEMYFVINTRRPMTDTLFKIEKMIDDIEASSRLKVTKLVNNTNILKYTTADDVIEGHKMIESISLARGIPIAFVSGFNDLMGDVETKVNTDVLYLNKLIKLPWD